MSHSGKVTLSGLNALLLHNVPHDLVKAEHFGKSFFGSYYMSGSWSTHDGQPVIFTQDRYLHGFRTAGNHHVDLINNKNVVARDRIVRIQWIGAIISGKIANCECWEVRQINGNPNPPDRLYINWSVSYGIYLWKLDSGIFKFSTAFSRRNSTWREKIKDASGTKIWP